MYAHFFTSNLFHLYQFFVFLFILYQMTYFTKKSVQYNTFDTSDPILGREVPAIVAFNNFNLLEQYVDTRTQNNTLGYVETLV